MFGYDPIEQKKVWYEIQIPSVNITLEAKNDKEALKKAKQGVDDLMNHFLLNPKYWKIKVKKVKVSAKKEHS